MDSLIYKIADRAEFETAMTAGQYRGSAVDLADGFIHFSTSRQVRETGRRHFAGKQDLLLVAVDPRRLGAALKYEASRGGDLFPHLYSPLDATTVVRASSLERDKSGNLIFPDTIP